MTLSILAPAAALALWSMVMLLWMVFTRLPAMAKLNLPKDRTVGGRGQDLEKLLPARINWKAHNYTHLMEQPTLFYATVIILAMLGLGTGVNLWLAWGYTAIRIVHSIWQSLVNSIPVRLSLFTLSSIILMVLTINALIGALHAT